MQTEFGHHRWLVSRAAAYSYTGAGCGPIAGGRSPAAAACRYAHAVLTLSKLSFTVREVFSSFGPQDAR